jgi:hypothetical protein
MKALAVVTVSVAAALSVGDASADGRARPPTDQAACLDAVAKGQALRDEHKVLEARAQFQVCARATCPAVVQRDCANWVAELDRALPTIVLSARDEAGKDVLDVTLSVDGAPLAAGSAGQALPIDPGLHTFRFERTGGALVTQQAVVREGEKDQKLAVVFTAPHPTTPAVLQPSPHPFRWSPMRVAAIVTGGAGVVAMGTGVGVAFNAKARDNTAAGEAEPARHTDSQSAANEGTLASVIIGVGAAAAVAGVVLWFTAPRADVSVGFTGHDLWVRGTF